MLFWSILLSAFLNQPAPSNSAAARPLKVQKLILPEEKLPDFFPKNEITLFKDEAEFDQLLQQYNARFTVDSGRTPTACDLEASFDPTLGRLSGKGRWRVAAGPAPKVRLAPWNLRVDSLQNGDASVEWGLDAAAELTAMLAPGQPADLVVQWTISAVSRQGRYAVELRIPNCASSRLRLSLPAGWTLRTVARSIAVDARVTEIHFGGSAGMSLELIPPAAKLGHRGAVAWQSDQRFRFEETGVEWRGEIRLEALHEPIETLNLQIDERFIPQELKATIPARWTSRETLDGSIRWTADFRRPVLGPFRIEVKGSLPAPAPGGPWRPPRVFVDEGLPRGENIALSIPKTLSIQSINDGNYERTTVGVSADGRLELVFSGVGGSPATSDSHTLEPDDVLDWAALCAELERDSKEPNPSVGKRVWELLDQTQRARIAAVARSGKASQTDRSSLVDALNKVLSRPDFFNAAASAPPAQSPAGVGKPSQIFEQNRRLLEGAFRSVILSGPASRGLPSIRLQPDHSIVETTHQVFFDLRRGRARLAARIGWKGLEGSLDRPSVWLPPGWTASTVEPDSSVDPSGPRLLSHRLEPNDERGNILWLQWDRPLGVGRQFKATIFAEPQEEPTFHLTETFEYPLPEIRPFEPQSTALSLYCLFLDPGLRCGKENLPPPQPGAVDFPWPRKPADVEEYAFQYVAPLQRATLRILAEQPRYSVESADSIEWNDDHWTATQTLEISVEQGLAHALTISCSRPLPAGIRWRVEGAGDAWISPTDQAPDGKNGRRLYRLEFPAPIDRKTRLLAQWTVPKPEWDVPLLEFPAADRFRSTIEVASPRGRPIIISPEGLPETDPARDASAAAPPGLIWSTAYARLPDGARVQLKVAPSTSEADVDFHGSARLVCQTVVEQDRQVQRIFASLDCRRSGPIKLRLPANHNLWSLSLDGEQVLPRARGEDGVELDPVPEGIHTFELIYSQPPKSWLGLPMAELLPPLEGFQITSNVWEVARYGESAPIGMRDARCIQFRSVAGEAAAEGREDVDVLQAAYQQLDEAQIQDLPLGLAALGRRLPVDWTLLIDQQAIGPDERAPSRRLQSRPAAVQEWLSHHGLTSTTRGRVFVVSDRTIAPDRSGRQATNAGWIVEAAQKVRADGEDFSGRFVAPSSLPSSTAQDPAAGARSDWRQPGLQSLQTFLIEASQPNSTAPLRLVLAPVGPLNRWSRLAALATAFAAAWLCRGWSEQRRRRVLTLLLVLLTVVYLVGGLPQIVAARGLWAAALVVGAFWVSRRIPRSAPGGAAILFFLSGPIHAQSVDAASPRFFRVLVPYNPDLPQRKPSQVIAAQSLLELLNSPPPAKSSPVLLQRLKLEGEVVAPDEVHWKGRIELLAISTEPYPLRTSLGFTRIKPESVRIDGASVVFFPPDETKGLAFSLPRPGAFAVDVDFISSLSKLASERSMDFGVPPAPQSSIRLKIDDVNIRLADGARPALWNVERQGDHSVVSSESGPTTSIQLRWRAGPIVAPAAHRMNVSSAVLVDASARTQDVFCFFRFDAPERNVEQLSFLAPAEIFVRRVEAPGLAGWTIENASPGGGADVDQDGDRLLTLNFDPPLSAATVVQIHGLVRRIDPTKIRLRPITPKGTQEEPVLLGVRLPAGWTAAPIEAEGDFEAETPETFAAAWKKIDQTPPSPLAMTLRSRKKTPRLIASLRRPVAQWSVEQNVALTPNPLSQAAEWSAVARIPATTGELQQLSFRAPENWTIQRAAATGMTRWFLEGSVATLLFDQPIKAPTEIQLFGRMTAFNPPKNWREPIVYAASAPQWFGAERTQTNWSIASPTGWRVQIDDRQGVNVSELESTTVAASSSDPAHSFRLTLQPIPPDVDVRSLIVVTIQGNEAVFDGRFDMLLSQGVSSRLEFRTPGRSDAVVWRAPDLRPPSSVLRGQNRIWSLEPSRPAAGGRMQIDWKISQKIGDKGRIPVPKVVPLGIPVRETWIVLNNSSDVEARPAERRSFSPGAPPLDPSAWPEGIVPTAAVEANGFHSESDDWQMDFKLQRHQPAPAPFRVRFGDLELFESQDGWIRAAMRWEILDQSADLLLVELPKQTQIDDLLVDSMPIPRPERTDAGVRFPLFRKSNWQEVVLYWSTPTSAAVDGRLPLPRLATDQQFPMLARIRTPAYASWKPHAAALRRADWLIRRLERTNDALADRLREWESRPGVQLEDRIAANLARSTALELQAGEAARAADVREEETSPVDALENQKRRREQLLAQYQAEPLTRRALEATGDAEDFAPSLSRANAELSAYYFSDSPLQDVVRVRRRPWTAAALSADRWIALATCLSLLLMLWSPWRRLVIIRYWPAAVLTLGAAWLRWGSPATVGIVFIGGALAGAWLLIQEWYSTPANPQEMSS